MKKTLLTLSTVAVVSLGGVIIGSDAVGAEPSLDEINQKQDKVDSKLSKTEKKLAETLNKMKGINEEVARIETAIKANEKEQKKVKEAINTLNSEVDTINDRIEERNEILKERLASYQANGGNVQFMEVLLGSKDPIEFLSRVDAVTTITNSDIELIEANEKDKEKVEEKIDEQNDLKVELEGIASTMEEQKEEENKKVAQLKTEKDKYETEKSKLTSESSELKELEARVLAELAAPAEEVVETSTNESNASTVSTSNSNGSNNSEAATSTSSDTPKKEKKAKAPAYTGAGGSAISAGKQFIGRSSYVFGAKNPSAGQFDCSGFVSWAYEQEGISLPRSTAGMRSVGSKVDYSNAKPGDLVFFDTYKTDGHVGIYLGGGQFIGSQSGRGVEIVSMNNSYWSGVFSGHVRRVK
ncbi:MAG TPA: C40 family peptidase [Candidatus Pseudogracilibacillus intestinigallinarum]|uniref:C40 family peptidase n=1 Tax=Candidatus Pseudogracilibacillus intestinigallinarum TaxID=2838742 RepID=A0A9D1PLE9_9BACI|nr:C40 family peptidase [Candidatus Pseudogracilibacillus intestinigallinarum]